MTQLCAGGCKNNQCVQCGGARNEWEPACPAHGTYTAPYCVLDTMVVNSNGQCQRCGLMYAPPCAAPLAWPTGTTGVCKENNAAVRNGVCRDCGLDWQWACPVSSGYAACRSPAMYKAASGNCEPIKTY